MVPLLGSNRSSWWTAMPASLMCGFTLGVLAVQVDDGAASMADELGFIVEAHVADHSADHVCQSLGHWEGCIRL